MKIGKGASKERIVTTEVDLTRNTELTGYFLIPTKESIYQGLGDVYFTSWMYDGRGCVKLYRYGDYYIEWNGKMYHIDSPEKYDVRVNIIGTDFALAQLE